MVDHKVLLSKLPLHGIIGNELNWIANYLLGRYQYVQYDRVKHSRAVAKFGVPQGSILGPLLTSTYLKASSILWNKPWHLRWTISQNCFTKRDLSSIRIKEKQNPFYLAQRSVSLRKVQWKYLWKENVFMLLIGISTLRFGWNQLKYEPALQKSFKKGKCSNKVVIPYTWFIFRLCCWRWYTIPSFYPQCSTALCHSF